MNCFLPEALAPLTPAMTPERLRRLQARGELVTGPALWCDEAHRLHCTVGGLPAVIPRAEGALGVAEGAVRDIAILSRVGKAVTAAVTAVPEEGPVILSRAAAQREARDHLLAHGRPGDILPAVITSLAPFGAFCDVGCGMTALLPLENISVSRIGHSRDRFRVGQEIRAVLLELDRQRGRITLTHKELLGTWEENAARFRPGQTVPGVVRSVVDYGVFIELAPNLSGLAEFDATLAPGDAVSVYIKSIAPDRRKIKLAVLGRADGALLPPAPLPYTRTEGHLDAWQYSPAAPGICRTFASAAAPDGLPIP